MHLTTVHSSSYYSGPTTAIVKTTVHCLNMTMTSRIMRGVLHSRNVDSRESQGTHTTITIGIIAGVFLGLLCVAAIIGWAHKSNKAAFAASGGQRGRVVRHGNKGQTSYEKGSIHNNGQAYQGGAGLNAPPRSYGGRSRVVQFPGPRNGYAARSGGNHSAKSNHARFPYCDASPYSATPTFEARGDQGHSRNQYSGRPATSQRSQK